MKEIISYGEFGYCPKCGASLDDCYDSPEFDDVIRFNFHCKECGTFGCEVYTYDPSHTAHIEEE